MRGSAAVSPGPWTPFYIKGVCDFYQWTYVGSPMMIKRHLQGYHQCASQIANDLFLEIHCNFFSLGQKICSAQPHWLLYEATSGFLGNCPNHTFVTTTVILPPSLKNKHGLSLHTLPLCIGEENHVSPWPLGLTHITATVATAQMKQPGQGAQQRDRHEQASLTWPSTWSARVPKATGELGKQLEEGEQYLSI